jgi:hypothetical protein
MNALNPNHAVWYSRPQPATLPVIYYHAIMVPHYAQYGKDE